MFVLQLSADDFNDTAVCLGSQIATVLRELIALPDLSLVAWYAASVDAIGSVETREAFQCYEAHEPRPIGDITSFASFVGRASQLLDGVIFSVPFGQDPVIAVELLSADGPIERQVANSIVEICAFDTSSIEIGTGRSTIIEHMQARFRGKMMQLDA